MDASCCSGRSAWVPLVAVLIAGGLYIVGQQVQNTPLNRVTVSVSGEGKISAIPDIAELSFGVQTGRQTTSDQAMKKLSDSMNAIVAAVKKEGIADKDMTTESLWLNPAYDWDEGTQIARGFEASQSLRVKVRDLAKIGAVLSAATKAGANQVGGVSFTIDDPEKLQNQAREMAIKKARANAEVLARQLGGTLGRVAGFSEGGGYYPPMPYMSRGMAAEGAADMAASNVPLPSGEQEITMSVSITYELN